MSGPWACKECGVRGHYRTSDPSMCAQRWGEWPSTFAQSATASGLRWDRVAKPARGRELCNTKASGLEWEDSGVTKPARGVELIHGDLATALASKTEFSQHEWDAFANSTPTCGALRTEHFIRSGEKHFRPIANLAIALKSKHASGLKWKKIASMPEGRDLSNRDLATALKSKTEFTQQEWEAFGNEDLRHDDFIRTDDDAYFTPSGTEFTPQEYGAFGICNLRMDQFVKAGDAYFKPAELAGDCKMCGKHADEHLPQHADVFVDTAASGVCKKCNKQQRAHFGTKYLCEMPDMYCFPKYQRIAAHNSNCKRCGKREAYHEGQERYCDARRCCMCWFKGPGEVQHLKDLSCKTCSTRSEAATGSVADTPPPPQEPVDHDAQIAEFAEFFKTQLGLPDPSEGEDAQDAEDLAKACVEWAHLRCVPEKSATDMRVLYLMPENELFSVFQHMPAAQKAYAPVILEALRACRAKAASTPRVTVEAKKPVSEWMEAMGLDTATAEAVSQKFEAHEAGKVQKLAERRVEALMKSQYDIQKKKCLPYVRDVLEEMKLNDVQWNERQPTDKLNRLRDCLSEEFVKADSDHSGHLTEDEFKAMGTLKALDDVRKDEAYHDLKDKDGIKEEVFNIAPVSGVPEITKGLVLAVDPSEAKTIAFSLPRTAQHVFLEAVAEAIKENKNKMGADTAAEPSAEAPPSDDANGESKRNFLISTDGLSKPVPEWLRDTVPDMFDEATILVVQHACRENRIRTCWSLMALESELDTIFSAALPRSVIKMLRQAIKRDPRRSQTKWKVDASLPSLKGRVKIYAPKAGGTAENGEEEKK